MNVITRCLRGAGKGSKQMLQSTVLCNLTYRGDNSCWWVRDCNLIILFLSWSIMLGSATFKMSDRRRTKFFQGLAPKRSQGCTIPVVPSGMYLTTTCFSVATQSAIFWNPPHASTSRALLSPVYLRETSWYLEVRMHYDVRASKKTLPEDLVKILF